MSIVKKPLVLSRACNGSYGAINESKTVLQWSSLGCYSIKIGLKVCRTKNFLIPVQYLVSMSIVNEVEHFIGNHTKNWHWFSKSVYHISISTRVRHSLK